MIPREVGEGLLSYLDRLTIMADERASLQVRFEALGMELATATAAEGQLGRYSALIEADQNKDSMSGREVTKSLTDSASDTAFPLTQFANSEINGEAKSEIPAHTGEIVTGFDRTLTWALAQTEHFDAADASFQLDLPEKSVSAYLARMTREGLLARLEATGKSRIPSRYRVAVSESEVIDEPTHLDHSRLPLDQRLLLVHLEKNGPMSQKLACAQLNWANSRADRAINELTRSGLLGRLAGLLKAIPPEVMAAD